MPFTSGFLGKSRKDEGEQRKILYSRVGQVHSEIFGELAREE